VDKQCEILLCPYASDNKSRILNLKNRGKREGERQREKESLDERESGSSAVQQPRQAGRRRRAQHTNGQILQSAVTRSAVVYCQPLMCPMCGPDVANRQPSPTPHGGLFLGLLLWAPQTALGTAPVGVLFLIN